MGKKEKKIGPITEAKHKKLEARKEKKKVRKASKPKGNAKPKAASKQTTSIQTAPSAVGGTARSYFNMKPLAGSGGQGVRVRGCDFLTTLTIAGSTAAGTAVFNMAMNPTALVGTRLATMVSLYEKYRFNRFAIKVIPCNATNIGGSYGVAYDRDPTDATPPVGDEGIREYMAMPGTVIATQWDPLTLNCPLMSPETAYFTNITSTSDERLVDQGQIYVFTASSPANALTFFIEIEYDISLYIPEIGTTSLSGFVKLSQKPAVQALVNSNASKLFNILSDAATWVAPQWSGALNSAVKYGVVPQGYISDGINYKGFALPPGIWTVVQSLIGKGAASIGWGASASFGPPTLQANDLRDQSDCLVDVDWNAGTSSAVTITAFDSVSSQYEIYVPPSGAWLMGSQGAIQGFDSAAGAGLYSLGIYPSKNSAVFSALLGKTKKFRAAPLAAAKDYILKKQAERESAEAQRRAAEGGGAMGQPGIPSANMQYQNTPQTFRV